MTIRADFHLHSDFSGDSQAPMESMIRRGIQLGLTQMCFTEHHDFDYPVSPGCPAGTFEVNTDAYLYDLLRFREKYKEQILVLFGVELGLQPHLSAAHENYTASYDFDFIIGSSHVCESGDPYMRDFYKGRSEQEAYGEYFSTIIANLKAFSNFDVYGHLDYVVRYGPNQDENYSYAVYSDYLEEILDLLIASGIGLEINTGGLSHGLKDVHPCSRILKRYREKGGKILTVGSDAHQTDDLCREFGRAREVLESCGFRYYTVFKNRKPAFIKL